MSTLSENSQDSLGWVYPAPPVELVPTPLADQRGETALIDGQAYINVMFHGSQFNDNWVLVSCEILNVTDISPLNITAGIITERTTTGFRLQLTGVPDSDNYVLCWAINGTVRPPTLATTYELSGPLAGKFGVAATFTVGLFLDTTVDDTVVVTPDDGGAGGTFAPTTAVLTADDPSDSFTYTPASYGEITISVTNGGTLIDPDDLTFTATADTYTFSGPSSGAVGVASTNFTVALPLGTTVTGTVTVTPSGGGGGGTFTPTTVALTTAAPSATFTYTPVSTGDKTLSVTNDGGLTDPDDLTYAILFNPSSVSGLKLWLDAESLGLTDGAAVTTWTDSSANGYDVTGTATYKTNIVNSRPVVRFNGTTNKMVGSGSIATFQPNTVIAVVKNVTGTDCHFYRGDPSNQLAAVGGADGFFYLYAGTAIHDSINHDGAFHVYTGIFSSGNAIGYVDGTLTLPSAAAGVLGPGVLALCWTGTNFYPGDIAEFLFYDSALGTTDRTNVENYLKGKYGL